MTLTYKDKLLAQKCVGDMIDEYRVQRDCFLTALPDLKLAFIEFLEHSSEEYIDYVLTWLKTVPEYALLKPIILEYKNYGIPEVEYNSLFNAKKHEKEPAPKNLMGVIWNYFRSEYFEE